MVVLRLEHKILSRSHYLSILNSFLALTHLFILPVVWYNRSVQCKELAWSWNRLIYWIYIYTPTHIYVYMPTYVYTHGFEVDIDTQWHGKNTCMNYKDDLTNMFFKKKTDWIGTSIQQSQTPTKIASMESDSRTRKHKTRTWRLHDEMLWHVMDSSLVHLAQKKQLKLYITLRQKHMGNNHKHIVFINNE